MHAHILPSGTSTTTRMDMGSSRAAAVSSSYRPCVQSAFARTESIPGGPLAPPQLASTSYSQDRRLAEACIGTLTAALESDTSTRFWCHQVNSGRGCERQSLRASVTGSFAGDAWGLRCPRASVPVGFCAGGASMPE